VTDEPIEQFENGYGGFTFMPSTVEEMLTACNANVKHKQVMPTEGFMRDLCERLLTLEQQFRD
jgi:hypothetical protein